MTFHLQWIDEFRIDPKLHVQIAELLREAFSSLDFPCERTYFKQTPQRRLLAWEEERLVGHVGLEHRAICLPTGPAQIFGIIDLCVTASSRGLGLASQMLSEIERLGSEFRIEFLILFADDPRVYDRNGFESKPTALRWLKIHEHQTLGIGEELVEELMIKPLTGRRWPAGEVDLLGYLF